MDNSLIPLTSILVPSLPGPESSGRLGVAYLPGPQYPLIQFIYFIAQLYYETDASHWPLFVVYLSVAHNRHNSGWNRIEISLTDMRLNSN